MHEDAPTLESAVLVQGHLPGVGILLTVPASYNPGLHGGCSACGGSAESGWGEVAMGPGARLSTCMDMGAEDQGWESGEMGMECWEGLRILPQSLGLWVGGWSWLGRRYVESRADLRDQSRRQQGSIWIRHQW